MDNTFKLLVFKYNQYKYYSEKLDDRYYHFVANTLYRVIEEASTEFGYVFRISLHTFITEFGYRKQFTYIEIPNAKGGN